MFDTQTKIPQKHIWTALLVPPLLLGLLLFAYAIASGPLAGGGGDMERAIRAALPYLIAGNHILVLGLLFHLLRRNRLTFRDLGWQVQDARTLIRDVAIGLLVGVSMYLFKEFVVDGVRALAAGRSPTYYSLFSFSLDPSDVPMIVVATTLVFVEESVYRGFAIPPLRARYGLTSALLLSSVCFGFLHWGNGLFAIGVTGTFGFILALVFVWRRNLIPGTIAHALYNLFVLLT